MSQINNATSLTKYWVEFLNSQAFSEEDESNRESVSLNMSEIDTFADVSAFNSWMEKFYQGDSVLEEDNTTAGGSVAITEENIMGNESNRDGMPLDLDPPQISALTDVDAYNIWGEKFNLDADVLEEITDGCDMVAQDSNVEEEDLFLGDINEWSAGLNHTSTPRLIKYLDNECVDASVNDWFELHADPEIDELLMLAVQHVEDMIES